MIKSNPKTSLESLQYVHTSTFTKEVQETYHLFISNMFVMVSL